jgi:hypothetical protein
VTTRPELVSEPFSLPVDESSISAVAHEADGRCSVTVVVSRAPGLPPIDGSELEARLFDGASNELPVLRRPQGELVEAGGSLGVSANATFEFETRAAAPEVLEVGYAGEVVRFRLVPADDDEEEGPS